MKPCKRIALIGNPNTGKSTLFNILTGSKQKIANYPGATVEYKKSVLLDSHSKKIELIDLPGCYSLNSTGNDENITSNLLRGTLHTIDKPDEILYVLDATNLKRNLYLFLQLNALKIPISLVLTMTDLLDKNSIQLDIEHLKEVLQVPLFVVNIHDKESYALLYQHLCHYDNHKIPHYTKLEREIYMAQEKGDSQALASIPQIRYKWIHHILSHLEKRHVLKKKTITYCIDRLTMHGVSGTVILVGILFLIFHMIYTLSQPITQYMEYILYTLQLEIHVPFVSPATNTMFTSFYHNALLGGVGSVIIFLPQIILLSIMLTILEDSGYLARASFLVDKLFAWSGLSGKSLIPLLSCYACAVPGILSTRIISDYKTRLVTILIAPLISCSARLPVYVLFIGTFIQPQYGVNIAICTLFFMHSIGFFLALPLSWLFKKNLTSHEDTLFYMEIPPYRKPRFRNIGYMAYKNAASFLLKAGNVILICSICIWLLSYFPRTIDTNQDTAIQIEQSLEHSYIGQLGKWIQPILAPLGYDWKLTVGILLSFPARELIISTLGVLYRVDDNKPLDSSLGSKIRNAKTTTGQPAYTLLTAFSLMVFFALCAQCFSTLVVIHKELNSYVWPIFTFVYMTLLAYLSAFAIYQIGSFFI